MRCLAPSTHGRDVAVSVVAVVAVEFAVGSAIVVTGVVAVAFAFAVASVSYTHLTLPTICSV
eukprot:9742634-Alexandrium_andersonii.AAC.1